MKIKLIILFVIAFNILLSEIITHAATVSTVPITSSTSGTQIVNAIGDS